ncbi:hypothetical protein ACQP1W_23810 [Spirillospora sp. CA-255316]
MRSVPGPRRRHGHDRADQGGGRAGVLGLDVLDVLNLRVGGFDSHGSCSIADLFGVLADPSARHRRRPAPGGTVYCFGS